MDSPSVPQIQELVALQKDLLSNFYDLNDFVKDRSVKTSISALIEKYRQSLDSIKNEIQFRYDIDLRSFKMQSSSDEDLISSVVLYHKLHEFFINFRKNLIKKQFDLKKNYKQSFQAAKLAKYSFNDEQDALSGTEDQAKELAGNLSPDAKIMTTTKKITSKLIQSSQVLQSSLVQSELNLEELTIQNDALTQLSDKYTFLKGVLEKSDGFINDIKLSTEKEKRKMYYALGFFALCVAYIVYSRLLKLFVRLFIYSVRLALGVFGLVSRRKNDDAVIVDFGSQFISPTLVDDGVDEIVYETQSNIAKRFSTGVAIESAIYEGDNLGEFIESSIIEGENKEKEKGTGPGIEGGNDVAESSEGSFVQEENGQQGDDNESRLGRIIDEL
jgi:protein transport protein SEC20